MYKNLLEYIAKNLVAYPEKVEISEVESDGKVTLKLNNWNTCTRIWYGQSNW